MKYYLKEKKSWIVYSMPGFVQWKAQDLLTLGPQQQQWVIFLLFCIFYKPLYSGGLLSHILHSYQDRVMLFIIIAMLLQCDFPQAYVVPVTSLPNVYCNVPRLTTLPPLTFLITDNRLPLSCTKGCHPILPYLFAKCIFPSNY